AFWRLAPGELQRLGGPDVQGFVVSYWRGKQTLSLARSMAFGLGICTDVIRQPEVDEEALQAEAAPAVTEMEPMTLPLRLGSPSLFPQALIGPWVRGLTVLHVREGFICEELDQTFPLQVFPEIIYPPWGEWVLNVSRSSPLVLEWAQQIDAGGIRSNRVIRWIRPWLLQGRLYVDSAGSADVNGSYIPDFTGTSLRYAKVEPGRQLVELRHMNEQWAFVSVGEGPEEIFYTAPAEQLLGQWDDDRQPHRGSGVMPAPRLSFWQDASADLIEVAAKELPWNVRPRCLCRLPSDAASMTITEGLADHFAGDAVIFVDATDSVSQIAPRLGARGPATWTVNIALSDVEKPNQPSGVEGKEDLLGSLRQAIEALRGKGVSTLAVGSRGGHGDSEALASASLGALLDVCGEAAPAERSKKAEKEQKPIELHFLVEGPPTEILRCRDAVEKAIAKRSDAGFINAMRDAGQAEGPAWLSEALLSQLKGKKGGSSTSGWRKQLSEDGAMRGIMASQFLKLADVVKQVLEKEEIVDSGHFAANPDSPLRWLDVNMYHICQHFILPLTRRESCSYVELVASDLQPPEWMVSHAWSTNFAATTSMLSSHARSRNKPDDGSDRQQAWMQTSYWCCTLANNQHDLSALREADLMKTPFARVLLSPNCCGTALLCDSAVTPLRRVWCVFEAHLTQHLRSGQANLSNKGSHFLDLVAIDMTQTTAFDPDAVAILQDGVSGWNEISKGLAHFPLEVVHVGTTVDIRQAEASMQSDRHAIMNHIAFGKGCRDPPPADHANYDKLNRFVHSAFASAELYRLACDRPEGCVERARELLELGADPNCFVREGNTAILALVGADPTQPNPADLPLLQRMLSLLVASGARINHVNSHMQTALDHVQQAAGDSAALTEYLKQHGALSFEDSAPAAEELWNERVREVLFRGGFGAPTDAPSGAGAKLPPQAFGGSGGGGSGAKLLGRAEQSLREAAAFLKIYPESTCYIETPSGAHDKHNLRGKVVQTTLQGAGATNPFELRCSGTYHPRGSIPLLRLKLALVKVDAKKEAPSSSKS
ncbi:HERC1, partial [Symbiodinium sp. CCMP2456]